jgi:hypothetical protein
VGVVDEELEVVVVDEAEVPDRQERDERQYREPEPER